MMRGRRQPRRLAAACLGLGLGLGLVLSLDPAVAGTAGAAGAAGPAASLQAGQVLRGRFVQERHLSGFTQPLRSEGHFVLAPGRGGLWRAERPFAVSTAITAAGLVQQVGDAETMRLSASRMPFLAGLYDMLGSALSGNWQPLERQFTVVRTGDDRQWQVQLTPRQGPDPVTMPFSAIAARGGRFVERVEISKPGGDKDELTFLDQDLSTRPLAADETAALDSTSR